MCKSTNVEQELLWSQKEAKGRSQPKARPLRNEESSSPSTLSTPPCDRQAQTPVANVSDLCSEGGHCRCAAGPQRCAFPSQAYAPPRTLPMRAASSPRTAPKGHGRVSPLFRDRSASMRRGGPRLDATLPPTGAGWESTDGVLPTPAILARAVLAKRRR